MGIFGNGRSVWKSLHSAQRKSPARRNNRPARIEPLEVRTLLAGEFTDLGALGITATVNGSVAWGDLDNDNDLDVLLTGFDSTYTPITKVYRNNGNNTFTDINVGLPAVYLSSAAWGDMDNDGNLDILLTGADSANTRIAKVYRNNGDSTFTDLNAGLSGVQAGSAAWGDADSDGDLDILLTGIDSTQLRTAKVYRNNGNNTFTDINAGLTGVADSSVAWGDADNDGDLDILLTGRTSNSVTPVSKIYRNNGNSTFTDMNAGLTAVYHSSAAWGDADNDGDLDVVLTGSDSSSNEIIKIYRNNGNSTFSEINASLDTGVHFGSIAWGDADNDGILDILLTGRDSIGTPVSKVYINSGGFSFSEMSAGLAGVDTGSAAWGDVDNDGDLDILFTGRNSTNTLITKVYRNNAATANTPPAAPTGLTTAPSSNGVGAAIKFVWTAPADTQTPAAGLSYNLRVGTAPGESDVFSTMASTVNGRRRLPDAGPIQGTSFTLNRLMTDTYYWSVQAIDTSLAGGAFAAEQTVSFPFTELTTAGLTGLTDGSVEWGDYNNDNFLDVLVTGRDSSNTSVTKLYRNNGNSTFTEINAGLVNVSRGTASWGDYDNDGDLDILLTGQDASSVGTAKVYRNNGNSTFTDINAAIGIEHLPSGQQTSGMELSGALLSTGVIGDRGAVITSDVLYVGASPATATSKLVDLKNANGDVLFAVNQTVNFTPRKGGRTIDKVDFVVTAATTLHDLMIYMDQALAIQSGSGIPNDAGIGIQPGVTLSGGRITIVGNTGTVNDIQVQHGDLTSNSAAVPVSFAKTQAAVGDSTGTDFVIYDSMGQPINVRLTMALESRAAGNTTYRWYVECVEDARTDVAIATGTITFNSLGHIASSGIGIFSLDRSNTAAASPIRVAISFYEISGIAIPSVGSRINLSSQDGFPAGSSPNILVADSAWGDFDNDGDLDILLSGRGTQNGLTKLYRNDSNNTFAEVNTGLLGLHNGSVTWGDYDNDGDLDMLLTGVVFGLTPASKIYRNNGNGTYTDINAGLLGVHSSSAVWGDFDNDGDLDLVLTGRTQEVYHLTRLYRNNGNDTFTELDVGLANNYNGDLAAGDYDNDGDLDILLTGWFGVPQTKLYRNSGNGAFTEVLSGLAGVLSSSAAWGDYDGDGDLDLIVTGSDGTATRTTKIYRNNSAVANIAPNAPTGLTVTTFSNTSLTLSWTAPTGDASPAAGLSYNLRVGTTPGGSDVFSTMANTVNGVRRIAAAGPIQGTSYTLKNLALGQTYYWSVQAVDTSFAGSAFAAEQSIVLNHAPVIAGAVTNQPMSDDATIRPLASMTVFDPDTQDMFARVTIHNGVVRGDFWPSTTSGWTRTVVGNDIVYAKYYSPMANVWANVQGAIRAFVFQPRQNAIRVNTTETTAFHVYVTDGVASANNNQTTVVVTSINNATNLGSLNPTPTVNDNGTVNPFAQLNVADPDNQELLARVTILNGAARGDFTNAVSSGWTRSTVGNDISYVRYFSPQANVAAAVQAAYRALIFQPRNNAIQPGTTELTDFVATIYEGLTTPATQTGGTRLTTTSVNDVPVIAGTVASQTLSDNGTKAVFSTATLTDPDTQDMFVHVTIDNAVNRGDFTLASASGWSRSMIGSDIVYTRYFSPAANIGATAQAAIRALVFQARANIPSGTTETTAFTVYVTDGIASTTNGQTSVVANRVVPRAAPSPSVAPPLLLEADTTTIVLPTVQKTSPNELSRLLSKSRLATSIE